jgi:hypothetical protein
MYFFGDDDDTIWITLKCWRIVFWIILINSLVASLRWTLLTASLITFASSEICRRMHGFLWVIHLEWGRMVRVEKLNI